MKLPKYTYSTLLILFTFVFALSCEEDDRDIDYLNQIGVPQNIDLLVTVSPDNSGTVTLTPTGDNSVIFEVGFGDGTQETVEVLPGESAIHVYPEGSFTATVTARNLKGEEASATKEVTVSFLPPENLVVTITPVPGDAFSIDLSAEADLATGFEVFWGDTANEEPTPFMIGETVTHTYANVGTYEVRVIALSGGSQSIEVIEIVVIEDPLLLPIDFESETVDYVFTDFNGAVASVIENPDPSGINTSSKVAQFFKEPGAEVFAGTILTLGAPVDFSSLTAISMDVWSPGSDLTVLLKLENAEDPSIFAEIGAQTTVANSWESLTFDFSNEDLTQEYTRVVFFFDFGNPGTGSTFYFDNVVQTQGSGGGTAIQLPVDFEDPDLNYTVFGFEGAESQIIDNPDPSGINTSERVVQTVKTVGAQFFAGTIVELDLPIDFSSSERISIKTWSPKAGIPVRLKLENADASQFVELDANTTVVDQWEELIWDFTGQTEGIDFVKVIIFFEFVVDLPGDGSIYYFDDIDLAD